MLFCLPSGNDKILLSIYLQNQIILIYFILFNITVGTLGRLTHRRVMP